MELLWYGQCLFSRSKHFRLVWIRPLLSIWPILAFKRFHQFQAFHGGHLSLKLCARNKGNKWYSSSSKGPFHRKYRTFWSHVIHSSVTDPAESISGKGWQALHLYCNFERLLLKIIAVSRRTKRFTLVFMPDWLPVPSVFCFLSMVIMFYICASSKQI